MIGLAAAAAQCRFISLRCGFLSRTGKARSDLRLVAPVRMSFLAALPH
jgi:hypothetical protein